MRIARLAAVAVTLLALPCAASIVTKAHDSGPDANRMVLAIVAEGYTSAEQSQFDADAAATIADFLAATPWSSHRGHVNVYTDFVASAESGADKPGPCYSPPVVRDTAFGASYCGFGTQRLLIVDERAVLTEIAASVPQADLIAVQVNDSEYGGAGGQVLTFSSNASARGELFLHEHGHTFARLADEYATAYPGFPPGDGEPNVDFDAARGFVDWDPWIDPATPLPTPPAMTSVIGCFEGARYLATGIHRPMADCRMRTLNRAFCPVCSEAVLQSLFAIVSPIDGETPVAGAVAFDPCDPAASVTLSVAPLYPADASWIVVTWEVDGVAEAETGPTLTLAAASLGATARTVTATVREVTPLVRRTFLSPMADARSWRLEPQAGPDRDADGVADGCDCAPDDSTAASPPAEVALLRVDARTLLSWTSVAASSDVARGPLAALRASGAYDGACLLPGAASALDDPDLPGPGAGFWYLVRGRNPCGAGSWGSRSDGVRRDVTACP